MKCPRCQQENPSQAKFCLECAAPLALQCQSCGTQLPPAAKFCFECAQPVSAGAPGGGRFASPEAYTPRHLAEKILASRGALEGERKQVTVLFADLKGSMELLADRDPEEARRVLDPALELMMDAVHRYEGTVNQVMGDGVMALFGAPLALEDHAVRACYAALRMQDSGRQYSDRIRRTVGLPVQLRVGLNSGEVVVRSIGSDLRMDYTAVGQTTHIAARMEQAALPGTILIPPSTLGLVEGHVQVTPLGPIPVRGLPDPVEVYEVVGAGTARSRLQAAVARGLTRFVGRDGEMDRLREALERAGAGHGQVVALVGEPGVGKSRLVWEFARSHRVESWRLVESGSVSYGKATPYLPVIDLLNAYFRVSAGDDAREVREKVTGKLLTLERTLEPTFPVFLALLGAAPEDAEWRGLDPRQRRQRTLDAVKRLLLRESQVQPLLVIFEDLHWIDSETQALIDSLVQSLPTARILLLVSYRPEYQHAWSGKTYYTQLRLDPLPPESADTLLGALLGADPGLESVKRPLIARTEGNPFFLEESVRALVETGVLAGERGAYRLARVPTAVQVPATVQALLAARIDRLSAEDKRLLQSASVVGKDVPLAVLEAVSDLTDASLHDGLARLGAAEFLYEARLFPDIEYTFKHALTHEVAYASLLQERRRELHRRAGEAIERLSAERPDEAYGLLARHFAESGDLAKGREYALRAAERAAGLFAHDEALAQYERARACVEGLGLTEEVAAAEEAIGDVNVRRGRLEAAVEAYERALRLPIARGRQAALKAKIGGVYGQFGGQRGLEFLHQALEELDPVTQRNEMAEVTGLLGRYRHFAGRHQEAIDLLERARELAEPLGDAPALVAIYGHLAGACQHLARIDESMARARRCVELGERTGLVLARLRGYAFLAQDLIFLGRWAEALAVTSRCAQIASQIGAEHRLAWTAGDRARILHGTGDLEGALAAARDGLRLAAASGEQRIGVWVHAYLAQIAIDLGDDETALDQAREAVASADRLGDRVLKAYNRYARAYVHLQREDWPQAIECLEQYVAIVSEMDNRLIPTVAGPCMAEILLGSERLDEAAATIDAAVQIAREAGSRHWEGVGRRVQGQILAGQARPDDARQALDDAVASLETVGSRLELARVLYRRGELYQKLDDRERARNDLVRARELFAATGARGDLGRAERLLTALETGGEA
ncbi:MAG TPA: tetratricopeptide repeat protein [Methylomirabilota bacterium]|nr:tetratricopeptide repeat protein [Methylomirabilota bacterium]